MAPARNFDWPNWKTARQLSIPLFRKGIRAPRNFISERAVVGAGVGVGAVVRRVRVRGRVVRRRVGRAVEVRHRAGKAARRKRGGGGSHADRATLGPRTPEGPPTAASALRSRRGPLGSLAVPAATVTPGAPRGPGNPRLHPRPGRKCGGCGVPCPSAPQQRGAAATWEGIIESRGR